MCWDFVVVARVVRWAGLGSGSSSIGLGGADKCKARVARRTQRIFLLFFVIFILRVRLPTDGGLATGESADHQRNLYS